jgi:fructose-bisphosphate aldolase class II
VKMNLDTDLQYAFTQAIEEHLAGGSPDPGGGVDKTVYDPRAWGRKAEQAMAARVAETCEMLGSVGRTLTR